MIILYHALDIASTISEAVLFYLVAAYFHLTPKKRIQRYIPFIFWIAVVYYLTWFTKTGVYKPVAITICAALLMCVVYRVSIKEAGISSMFSMILVLLSETVTNVVSFFFIPTISIISENYAVQYWPKYIILFGDRFVIMFIIYLLFKKFIIQFSWKDFFLVLFSFVVIQIMYIFYLNDFYGGNQNYFNMILEVICLSLSIGLLTLFYYFKNYYILLEREKKEKLLIEQMQRKFAYYRDKQADEERIQRIYHDLKNHLLLLGPQQSSKQEVQQAIADLQKQIATFENYYHTGNEFLDIIVRDKAKKAQERQIDFNAAIHFEDGKMITPLDISTIFGNALDNAIEACEKLPTDLRLITIKTSRIRDMLIVVVENYSPSACISTEKTSKKDIFLHGFGFSNIKNAVEKYGGECITKTENKIFTLKIIIPISQ